LAGQQNETAEDWEKKYLTGDKPWDLGRPEAELVRFVESGWLKPGADILELGCGTGTDSVFLAKKGFHVVGVDFSPTAIEQARDKTRTGHLDGNCQFFLEDACNLSFLKIRFDFAYDKTCFDNLEASKRPDYIRSVKSVLEPDAKFLVILMDEPDKGLSEENLRNLFGAEFRISSLEKTKLKHVGHDHAAWKMLLQMTT
jgi:ubiquinone/menaquinone biosynthesis C-methylase UbiE